MQELLEMINRVATTKTNILIIGESGTGKELVARMIHDTGPLKDKPFVPVNCGAIPENSDRERDVRAQARKLYRRGRRQGGAL